jgi:hypothetical protein
MVDLSIVFCMFTRGYLGMTEGEWALFFRGGCASPTASTDSQAWSTSQQLGFNASDSDRSARNDDQKVIYIS